jgi:hypothetical protein
VQEGWQAMPKFSRGLTAAARRDLARIYNNSTPQLQAAIRLAYRRLMADIRRDPHLKGSPAPMLGFPNLRRLESWPLRMFFAVRQPPLMDLYVAVVGFSRM